MVLVVGQLLRFCKIGGKNTGEINLARLVRCIHRVCLVVKGVNELRQLWLGAVVVGIRHKDDLLAVRIFADLEWTSAAATLVQVISEVCTILVNQALLNHVGAGVGQCIQEVRSFLVGDDHHGIGIGF